MFSAFFFVEWRCGLLFYFILFLFFGFSKQVLNTEAMQIAVSSEV